MSLTALIIRLLVAIVLSFVMFLLLALAGYYVAWYFFGLTGHPAAPNVPVSAYWAYGAFALLLSVTVSARLAFRRGSRDQQS